MKSASFLLTPLREGRRSKPSPAARPRKYFYSRPCGRGDLAVCGGRGMERLFLLTPLREGRRSAFARSGARRSYFYSRPCGRGDLAVCGGRGMERLFLLTPLREGRLPQLDAAGEIGIISTHAPAGGATQDYHRYPRHRPISTHAPAGGATRISTASNCWSTYFYSRPCGRGDCCPFLRRPPCRRFLLTPLREGRRHTALRRGLADFISTHAPAGGATRRDGRPQPAARHFYSRPCGRGDIIASRIA